MKARPSKSTYINTFFSRISLLSPADLRRLSFAQSEHAEHLPDPARDSHDDANFEILPARVDIHVRARHEVAKYAQCFRCVERIAKGCSECILTGVEASRETRHRLDSPAMSRLCGPVRYLVFRVPKLILVVQSGSSRTHLCEQGFDECEKVLRVAIHIHQ